MEWGAQAGASRCRAAFLTPFRLVAGHENCLKSPMHSRVPFARLVAVLGALVACFVLARVQAGNVVINEVMAENRASVPNSGTYPDWIEFYNKGDQSVNLAGMRLSDTIANPYKYSFPSNVVVPARGFLVVWCDNADNLPGLHAGFALSSSGGLIGLFSADTIPVLQDSVSYGFQAADYSIGRVPDGTGAFVLTSQTAALPNTAQAVGSQTALKINEWMAKPSSGNDWFEVYNPGALPVAMGGLLLTDTASTPANTEVPSLSFIAPHGWRQFVADKDPLGGADHVNFKISASGQSIYLFSAARTLIDSVTFGAQTEDVSQGRLPDGASAVVGFASTPTPGEANYLPITSLVINEVLAHTDPPLEDAIEFYNPTDASVDISGWYISNNIDDLKRFKIPAGTVVAPRSFKVFYEWQFNPAPGTSTSFTLNSAHGDDIYLSSANAAGDLSGYRLKQKVPASANGVSMGRIVTAAGVDFAPLSGRTFGVDSPATVEAFRLGTGGSNAAPALGPLTITEIMYHPPDVIVAGVTNDNVLDEYIEIQNTSSSRVVLFDPNHRANTWQIGKAVSYVFPGESYLEPGEVCLVVGFDPIIETSTLESFQLKYSVPFGVSVFGPWKGKLVNSSDTIELLRPDAPQIPPHPDAGYVPYLIVDKVKYADVVPWPFQADGFGKSLHRTGAATYGNEPSSWTAATPSPGTGFATSLRISSVSTSAGQIVVSFNAVVGQTYSLQTRDNVASGTWTKVSDVTGVTSTGLREVTDAVVPATKARFYRIVTPAQP